ncbi:hypothetical protein SK128_017998 [Halocaridina rubra]|uniref:FK506-binding protein 15-like domain-containing protein n=1 Tax=Halocaridina rubra TaxID=373956 RepID=A0AAN8WVM0_HALRR
MFLSGGDDDDESDFMPSSSSKLSALFTGPSSKSSNLKYVAPKQPRSDSTGADGEKVNSAASGQQGQTQAPVVLMATAVHAYLYVNGAAQSQGRVMCCILGNVSERNFDLLMYRSKQDHLTRTKIHQHFTFTVLPNNYANFSDDQQRNWSIMIDTGQYSDFIMQIGLCRAICFLHGNTGKHLVQDVVLGEGPALKDGDHAQISYSTWNIKEGKQGDQADHLKSSQRIKLKDITGTWESGIHGAQKNGRRLIFTPNSQDSTMLIFYDVFIDKVKQKGGDQSGRNTPQVDLQHHQSEISNSNRSLNILPEDDASNHSDTPVPASKATIVSRMARMGHALLPAGVVSARHPPTDSESEVEEISRRKHKYSSGSISGSVEELVATPAVRSRAASARSDAMKPEPAPRPSQLSAQPQQLVVYQNPWQQPALLPPGYPSVQVPVQPQPSTASDPTISLLFSETRSQNTELKISVSKMSDKIDVLTSKIESMEQQFKDGGNNAAPGMLVPSRLMTVPQHDHSILSTNAFDPKAVLAQITALVTDNEDMKAKVLEKDTKISALNDSLTQLLQKNQRLLEEKTDMLMAKQQESGTTVSITEVIALREEKAGLNSQLGAVQSQYATVKEELLQTKNTIEKQKEEIDKLNLQATEEKSKRLDFENMSEKQRSKEVEMSQSVKDLQAEKEKLERLINEMKSQEQLHVGELQKISSKNAQLQDNLKASEAEVESLKSKLQTTLQLMEERTRGDGESCGEKEMEEHLRQEIQSKNSKIGKLEKELLDLQSEISQIKQDKAQDMDAYQTQLQNLMHEKEALEKSSAHLQNATANSEEVVNTVKKVMNSVFRTLKPQFSDEGTYSGAKIMQTLLTVIRDTTLQLLEDMNKEKNTDEGSLKSGIASDTLEDGGNDVNKAYHMQANANTESPKSAPVVEDNLHSETTSVSIGSMSTDPHFDRPDNEGSRDIYCVNMNHNNLAEERVTGLGSLENCKEDSFDTERGIEDIESKVEMSSSEGEYTDASERQFSPKSSLSSSSDSNSYECEKPSNTISIGSGRGRSETGDNLSHDVITADHNVIPLQRDNSDAVENEPKTPVIDMENTDVKNVASEKSDSSRDSSLDRAWRPQPPPPPLFSDDDDEDDDWLS